MSSFSVASETSSAKRSRISSRSQATDQLPYGKAEVGRKGFANVPVPPVVRRTTTGVKTRSAAKTSAMTASTVVGVSFQYHCFHNGTEKPFIRDFQESLCDCLSVCRMVSKGVTSQMAKTEGILFQVYRW